MILRQAELKDIHGVLDIVSGLYLNIPQFVWIEEDFVKKQIENKEYFVMENEGKLIGVMSLRQRFNKMSIETLVVKKEFQTQGCGTKFIEFAKEFSKNKGFAILHAYSFSQYNIANFYLKKGFRMLNYPGFYKNHKYDCFELTL